MATTEVLQEGTVPTISRGKRVRTRPFGADDAPERRPTPRTLGGGAAADAARTLQGRGKQIDETLESYKKGGLVRRGYGKARGA